MFNCSKFFKISNQVLATRYNSFKLLRVSKLFSTETAGEKAKPHSTNDTETAKGKAKSHSPNDTFQSLGIAVTIATGAITFISYFITLKITMDEMNTSLNKRLDQTDNKHDKQVEKTKRQFELSQAKYDKQVEETKRQFELSQAKYDKQVEETKRQFELSQAETKRQFELTQAKHDKQTEEMQKVLIQVLRSNERIAKLEK